VWFLDFLGKPTDMTQVITDRSRRLLPLVILALLLTAAIVPASAPAAVPWQKFLKAEGRGRINDIAARNGKGLLTITSGIHLWRVGRNHKQKMFVKKHGGRLGYLPDNPKFEQYIAQVPPTHCSGFSTDDIYGFSGPHPRVVRVTRKGKLSSKWMKLPGGLEPSGIVFDDGGLFGNRLLVADRDRSTNTTVIYAIGCPGKQRLLVVAGLPRIEGGLAIAPSTFGPYAGWLLGTDEGGSTIYAISPTGEIQTVIVPAGVPEGGDIGLESLGVVPAAPTATTAAFLSDRRTPGNIRRGDGLLLSVSWPALQSAGVQPGDVLAATEGGALTFAIRCTPVPPCTSQFVAFGRSNAHVEGNLIFADALAKDR
jgi:hypothetical protein